MSSSAQLNPFTAGTYQNRALQEMYDKGKELKVQIDQFSNFRAASSSILLNEHQQAYLIKQLGNIILKICIKTSNPSMAAVNYPCLKPTQNPFNSQDPSNEILEKRYSEGQKVNMSRDQITKNSYLNTMVTIIEKWDKFVDESHFSKPLSSFFLRELCMLGKDMCASKQGRNEYSS